MSLLAAVAFLTVLPLPGRWRVKPGHLAHSTVWFPLVGLGVGLLLAALDYLIGLILTGPARDGLIIAAALALTGALHLDGLMDTSDGFFATVVPERRLEIMRDSHVGSFGVAAGGLVLLGKYAALASLGDTPRWAALVAMAVLGRWAMSFAVAVFPGGRSEGLGRLVKDATHTRHLLLAGAFAALTCGVVLQVAGLLLFFVATAITWLAGRALLGKLPGLTGDSYGALNELVELTALMMAPVCLRLLGALLQAVP